MSDNPHFYDLGDEGSPGEEPKNRESVESFLMTGLLNSKIASHKFDPDGPSIDQIVNMYLIGKFKNVIAGREAAGSVYYRSCDHDVHQLLEELTNDGSHPTLSMTIYEDNAWGRLFTLSMEPETSKFNPHAHQSMRKRNQDLGATYYDYAKTYARLLRIRHPTMPDTKESVFGNLAHRFQDYVELLRHFSEEHLNFRPVLTAGEAYHLVKDCETSVHDEVVHKLKDIFLDAFSAWNSNPTPENRVALENSISLLSKSDPLFKFQWPS